MCSSILVIRLFWYLCCISDPGFRNLGKALFLFSETMGTLAEAEGHKPGHCGMQPHYPSKHTEQRGSDGER